MDVRCERCGTDYEFDESKVTDAGVTVKCANCGNLFKVRRRVESVAVAPTIAMPAQGGAGERPWTVHNPSTGESRQFRELTTLQQWIVERRVTREDQISRTGETWKTLGDIAELAPFFHVVDLAIRNGTAQAPQPFPNTGAHPAYDRTMPPGAMTPIPSPPQPMQASGPTFASQAFEAAPPGPAFVAEPGGTGPITLGAMPAVSRDPSFGADTDTFGDVDELYAATRPRRGLSVLLVLVLLGGAGYGLYTQRDKLPGLLGRHSSVGEDVVRAAREAFLLDTDDGYTQAEREYQRAQAAGAASPRVAGGLAEVHALYSFYLREDARLLDARILRLPKGSSESGALKAQADAKRRSADQRVLSAKLSADEALGRGADDPDVNRAYATYLTVSAAPLEVVNRYLGKARPADAETLYVQGLLLLRERRNDEARRVFKDAIGRAGERRLWRAEYALAVAEQAAGDLDAAKETLTQLGSAHPQHARAQTLAEEIEFERAAQKPEGADAAATAAGPPSPMPAPPAPGAGTPPPLPPPAPSEHSAKAPPEHAAKAPPPDHAAKAPPKRSSAPAPASAHLSAGELAAGYDVLIVRGNNYLEHGQPQAARQAFEAALKQRPGGFEAETGIGNYFASVGKTALAVLHFQKAADHGYPEAFFYLAETQRMSGEGAEALANYRRYLAHGARGQNAQIAQRAIRDLAARYDAPTPADPPRAAPSPLPALPPPALPPLPPPEKEEKPMPSPLPPSPSAPPPAPTP
jgi:predicted Zn finger-like uncharacterized protein